MSEEGNKLVWALMFIGTALLIGCLCLFLEIISLNSQINANLASINTELSMIKQEISQTHPQEIQDARNEVAEEIVSEIQKSIAIHGYVDVIVGNDTMTLVPYWGE